MKLTVLIENTTENPDYKYEHGLSFYIETASHNILFDTGQSSDYAENARKMGINLTNVDFAVLSHGHYDHGGGIEHFLEINRHAKIYIHKNAFAPFYREDNHDYIGINKELRHNKRIILTDNCMKITDNIHIVSGSNKTILHKGIDQELAVMRDGILQKDDFSHEQYLYLTENNKKILITGCAHKGILNIINWFEADYVIGGFHFMPYIISGNHKNPELEGIADKLLQYPATYYTNHCTGIEQFNFLKARMQNKIHYLSTGQRIILS